jgi:hypothetical protein
VTAPEPPPDPDTDRDTGDDTDQDMERADTANGERPPSAGEG